MSDLQQIICEAVDIIVNKRLAELNFNKTIRGEILACTDQLTGQYSVRYEDSIITAYSNSPTIKYESGDKVFILIPDNDFSNRKTITGYTAGSEYGMIADSIAASEAALQQYLSSLLFEIEKAEAAAKAYADSLVKSGGGAHWYGEGVPTSSNYPAGNWYTPEQRKTFVGTVYFDTLTGMAYVWHEYATNYYDWLQLTYDELMLKDFNDSKIEVGETEKTIASLQCQVVEDRADYHGHVYLTGRASEACEITIRIKDNDITELYSPSYHKVSKGKFFIGIPHAYLSKLSGEHIFSVTAQTNVGTVSFDARDILYTVIIETANRLKGAINFNIVDLTLKYIEDQTPEIYAAAINNQMLSIYSHSTRNLGEGVWEKHYEVGPVLDAAIEFDGICAYSNLEYMIFTDDKPWIFWIDTNKTLQAQYLDETSSRVILDTNVKKIWGAVKGWGFEPNVYWNLDSGDLNSLNDFGLMVLYQTEDDKIYLKSRIIYPEILGGEL